MHKFEGTVSGHAILTRIQESFWWGRGGGFPVSLYEFSF